MNHASLLQELTERTVQRLREDPKFREKVYDDAARTEEFQEALRSRLMDSTNIDAQKSALQTLKAVGSAAMSTKILAALRDLLVTSAALRGGIVRLIAEEGVAAIGSPGMIEALLQISGDESAETRRWCVVALSCVSRDNLEVRKRLASIAFGDPDENVKLEAEAALVEANTLHASLLNRLRDTKGFWNFLNLLAADARSAFQGLYLPDRGMAAANSGPVRLGSRNALNSTRIGTSGDIDWALVQNEDDSYKLFVDYKQAGMEGQIVQVREMDAPTTLIGFIVLRQSRDGLSHGELEYRKTLPEQPNWHFHLHDSRTVPEDEFNDLKEYYESVRKDSPSDDNSHWENWLQLVSARLNGEEDLEQGQ